MVTNNNKVQDEEIGIPGCALDIETLCWEESTSHHQTKDKITKYDRVCTRNTHVSYKINSNTVHEYKQFSEHSVW